MRVRWKELFRGLLLPLLFAGLARAARPTSSEEEVESILGLIDRKPVGNSTADSKAWSTSSSTDPTIIDFMITGVNRTYALEPLLWNTTVNPTILILFNFTTRFRSGRLFTIVAKDPMEKPSIVLFSLEVDYTFGNLAARIKNVFGEIVDSTSFQVADNATVEDDSGEFVTHVSKTLLIGVEEGDLQLKARPGVTYETPDWAVFSLIQLHGAMGADRHQPALVSEGLLQLTGVEVTTVEGEEAFGIDFDDLGDSNSTGAVSGAPLFSADYVEKISNLLKSGGISMPEFLRKYNNNDAQLDEKSKMALSCSAQEKSLCENAQLCFRPSNSSFFRCICREGFGGQYCQFSLFPPTCAEALAADPKRTPGVYQLDVDGTGPLRATFAECLRDGRTIVTHNAPNRTEIRDSNDESSKLFSTLQLQGLKERSARCEQFVRYDCERAALGFDSNMTWFEAAGHANRIAKIGSAASEHSCTCRSMECAHHRLCTCAHPDAIGWDEGTFFDEHAAVEMIFVRKHPTVGRAHLTLGPLECFGDAGHDPARTWTLKSRSAVIPLGIQRALRFLEFEFRTHDSEVPVLLAGRGTVDGQSLNISLSGGHKLELKVASQKTNFSITLMSQARLNDLKWHRVLIELARQEIRFSVDHLNAFYPIDVAALQSELRIGNTGEQGMIGCVRGLRLNNELLELKEEEIGSGGRFLSSVSLFIASRSAIIAQGCPDLCRAAQQHCEQDSRCIEHFDSGTTSCECRNNLVHYGTRCEKNINVDTEVSFHDKTIGFLKFLNNDLPANPLTSSVVFSVRTDQRTALFFYAHDHLDNFIQVHLENEYKIVLTMSNATDIVRCAIYADDYTEFSDMRWLQIAVLQTAESISLQVEDAACELPGAHVLATSRIQVYGGNVHDAILPPPPVISSQSAPQFWLLFVGGVPRVQKNRYPREAAADEWKIRPVTLEFGQQQRERLAHYITDIPPLLGCMRGFMIGTKLVDLRTGGVRPNDPDAIRIGCSNDCDSLKCANSGHCSVHWQDYDPADTKHTVCDCSKTSYYGAECTKDTGVRFGGEAALVFNMSEPRRFVLTESEKQTLSFAFVPRARRLSGGAQRLASIRFDDERQLDVELCRNSSVNLVFRHPSRTDVYTFGGNFTDGFRHFFHAHFLDRQQPLVLVDGEKRFLAADAPIHLAAVREFWFGGTPDDELELLDADPNASRIHNFEGCMSNIDIDYHRNEAVHFTPLLYYQNSKDFYHKSVHLFPEDALPLAPAECAAFKIPGSLPTEQRNVQLPVWEAQFMPVFFNDTEEVEVEPRLTDKYEWVLMIAIGVLIAVAILLLLCCCYCLFWYRRTKRQGPASSRSDAIKSSISKPLATSKEDDRGTTLVTDTLTFIKPDQPLLYKEREAGDLEGTFVPKTNSIVSSSTYYTAPEHPHGEVPKGMSESQMTATAADSDDETLTSYDDRPLSVVSEPNVFFPQPRQSPPRPEAAKPTRPPPTLSTFRGGDTLQPQRPVGSGRFTPVFPSLRRPPHVQQLQQPIRAPTAPPLHAGHHSSMDAVVLLDKPPKATHDEDDDDARRRTISTAWSRRTSSHQTPIDF
ncbi:hypothetical protein M3Y99_00454900 [Aphelenchoides fujianensis]|nr:hypothetical protein M3Y99_00454900 [Aphelenchoides fujianensis]